MVLKASSAPYWFLHKFSNGELTLSTLHCPQAHLIPNVHFLSSVSAPYCLQARYASLALARLVYFVTVQLHKLSIATWT